MEETNADARLPPRKRLLAGMKKQNSDCSSPSSPLSSISSDMSSRLRDLLSNNFDGSNVLTEEIVEASRSAALVAANVAAAARAAAEEKAGVAAKAVAAAKSALDLVATFSVKKSRKERGSRKDKNKPKKHVPVQVLYKKRKRGSKGETDEELARKLHRVMNSSPRILKTPSRSDSKVQTHKKHRKRLILDTTVVSSGVLPLDRKPSFKSDVNVEAGDKVRGNGMVEVNNNATECPKTHCLEMDSLHVNGEEQGSHSTVQVLEDTVSAGRKRGRIKQKKLSLSLCSVRDRESTKEEPKSRGYKLMKEPKGKSNTPDDPLLTVKPSNEVEVSQEAVSTWQHKEFTAPQCYAGSNILGSLCSNPTIATGSSMVEVDQ